LNSGFQALVIAAHGRHYVARTDGGERLECVVRSKSGSIACGDVVLLNHIAKGQAVVEAVSPRTNLVYRSDAFRTKLLAANVTQLAIVVAAFPSFSEDLLGRALVASSVLKVPALIVLNKSDLADSIEGARLRLAPYVKLGYQVLEVSVKTQPESCSELIMPRLAQQTTLLMGQSGMGKSSLLNLIVPDAMAATREISLALHSGKHTTTDARLYELAANSAKLIDTPGFQEFGLAHLTPGEVERAFVEFEGLLGQCRFYNCTHLSEPGCAIREAAQRGQIAAQRYALFCTLTRECRPSATHS
jgi:ribosome biogenesis GTPase / thiamine phosphate phosphatase